VNPTDSFDLDSYDYQLPEELIAQIPASKRESSRLLLVDHANGRLADLLFPDIISFIQRGDVFLFNDTRVFPARFFGTKETGGKVEILLLEYPRLLRPEALHEGKRDAVAFALIKSSKRPKQGSAINIGPALSATVLENKPDGKVQISLSFSGELSEVLERYGSMPLPPYIRRPEGELESDRRRYQTIFARETGAVAAPTAGLHFSKEIFSSLQAKGVVTSNVTLHVGYGTFSPVRSTDIRQHSIHSEHIVVSEEAAGKINRAKREGKRIWCVGTTAARAVEFCASAAGKVGAFAGPCNLYIYPGYRFKVIDNLLTNFHLPKSSLLFLVSALAGRETILSAYRHAIEQRYRFFSYGDAMLIMR
jgi:S-adenosylmethionine:tRNA ribosyltransferase-isomerase